MRLPTAHLRALVVAAAAAVALTGCGSSGGSDEKESTGSGTSSTSQDGDPGKDDFADAEKALAELKKDYQAVYDAGSQVQKTSVAYFKTHKTGTADDSALEPSRTALDEAISTRDDARKEVDDLAALKDPDVKTAYDAYAAKAAKGDPYHDTLYAGFPLLQQVFAACDDVFTSTRLSSQPASFEEFGRKMLARYEPAIADCLPALKTMSGSDNADLAAFATGFADIVTERRTLMQRLAAGTIAPDRFNQQYKQQASRVSTIGKRLDFQQQLNTLSPVREFLALEKVVAGKAG